MLKSNLVIPIKERPEVQALHPPSPLIQPNGSWVVAHITWSMWGTNDHDDDETENQIMVQPRSYWLICINFRLARVVVGWRLARDDKFECICQKVRFVGKPG